MSSFFVIIKIGSVSLWRISYFAIMQSDFALTRRAEMTCCF